MQTQLITVPTTKTIAARQRTSTVIDGFGIDLGVWRLLRAVGVPIILLAFYVDGMVIGKVLPPAALYITYLALVSSSTVALVALTTACVIASTLGQWTLYRWLLDDRTEARRRRWLPYVHRIPSIARARIGRRRMLLVSRNFDRFGGPALGVTNAIPGIRSIMTIPAGLSEYPQHRFVGWSMLGNAGYLLMLYLVARGVVKIAGLLPPVG